MIDLNSQQRLELSNRVSILTIIINVALSVVKLVAGILTMSLSVVSDAIHSVTDVFTTVVVMIGMKIAAADGDKEHPYGHEKFEAVASKLLAAILGIVAAFILYGGIMKLLHGSMVEVSFYAIGVTVASIVVKEWMYQYTKRAAKKINSNALLADAWHHRSDSISSMAVLLGLLFAKFGIMIAEPIATIIVSLMIIKVAVSIYFHIVWSQVRCVVISGVSSY